MLTEEILQWIFFIYRPYSGSFFQLKNHEFKFKVSSSKYKFSWKFTFVNCFLRQRRAQIFIVTSSLKVLRVFWYKPVKGKRWKNVKCNRRQRRNWIRTVLIRHESKPLPYSCFQFQCILPSRPSVNLCPMTTRGTCCFPNLSCLLFFAILRQWIRREGPRSCMVFPSFDSVKSFERASSRIL